MRLSALLFCMLAITSAMAQEHYPNRPVKILVPYGPGGATDIIARIVAQHLTSELGQSFIVENRPGANGNLALEAAAKATPDGYTLLVGNVSTNAINENIYASSLSIKPSRDLAGVAKLVEIPHIVVAPAAVPTQRLAELPNVPTLAEQGFPGIGTNAWQGMFAPAATPKAVIDALHRAVGAALTRPETKDGLAKQMMSVEVSRSPQEF